MICDDTTICGVAFGILFTSSGSGMQEEKKNSKRKKMQPLLIRACADRPLLREERKMRDILCVAFIGDVRI
jgi:hypothetical protein